MGVKEREQSIFKNRISESSSGRSLIYFSCGGRFPESKLLQPKIVKAHFPSLSEDNTLNWLLDSFLGFAALEQGARLLEKAGSIKVSRRGLLIVGGFGLAGLTLSCAPPEALPTPEPAKLQSIAREINQLEMEFNEPDLANKEKRERMLELCAELYAGTYPVPGGKERLVNSVNWILSHEEFLDVVEQSFDRPCGPECRKAIDEATRIVTDVANGKIYIDVSDADYIQKDSWPEGVNPLVILKGDLFHEFGHLSKMRTLTEQDKEGPVHLVLQVQKEDGTFAQFFQEQVAGFEFVGKLEGEREVAQDTLDEAAVHLLGLYPQIYYGIENILIGYVPVFEKARALDYLVVKQLGLSYQELYQYHYNSDFSGFTEELDRRVYENFDRKAGHPRENRALKLLQVIGLGDLSYEEMASSLDKLLRRQN